MKKVRVELTTDELSLLSSGEELTSTIEGQVITFSQEDLDIPLEKLVAGEVAHVDDFLEVSYS